MYGLDRHGIPESAGRRQLSGRGVKPRRSKLHIAGKTCARGGDSGADRFGGKNLAVCSIADTTLQVQGQNFLQLRDRRLQIRRSRWAARALRRPHRTVCRLWMRQTDSTVRPLTFTVPMGQLAPGMYQAVIQNPGQDACSTTMPIGIDVVGVPTATNATPRRSVRVAAPSTSPEPICTAEGLH